MADKDKIKPKTISPNMAQNIQSRMMVTPTGKMYRVPLSLSPTHTYIMPQDKLMEPKYVPQNANYPDFNMTQPQMLNYIASRKPDLTDPMIPGNQKEAVFEKIKGMHRAMGADLPTDLKNYDPWSTSVTPSSPEKPFSSSGDTSNSQSLHDRFNDIVAHQKILDHPDSTPEQRAMSRQTILGHYQDVGANPPQSLSNYDPAAGTYTKSLSPPPKFNTGDPQLNLPLNQDNMKKPPKVQLTPKGGGIWVGGGATGAGRYVPPGGTSKNIGPTGKIEDVE